MTVILPEPVPSPLRSWSGGPVDYPRPSDLLHDSMSVLAKLLAQPLREAFRQHLEEHDHPAGFGACPEAMRLFKLLPAGDQMGGGDGQLRTWPAGGRLIAGWAGGDT